MMEYGSIEVKTVLKHGWLVKSPRSGRKHVLKKWRERYFEFCEIASGSSHWLHLYYYKDFASYKTRAMPSKCIDVSIASNIGIGKKEVDGHRHILQIEMPGRTYYLSASSCEDMFDWNLVLRSKKFNDASLLCSPDYGQDGNYASRVRLMSTPVACYGGSQQDKQEDEGQSLQEHYRRWTTPSQIMAEFSGATKSPLRGSYEMLPNDLRLRVKFMYCEDCRKRVKVKIPPVVLYENVLEQQLAKQPGDKVQEIPADQQGDLCESESIYEQIPDDIIQGISIPHNQDDASQQGIHSHGNDQHGNDQHGNDQHGNDQHGNDHEYDICEGNNQEQNNGQAGIQQGVEHESDSVSVQDLYKKTAQDAISSNPNFSSVSTSAQSSSTYAYAQQRDVIDSTGYVEMQRGTTRLQNVGRLPPQLNKTVSVPSLAQLNYAQQRQTNRWTSQRDVRLRSSGLFLNSSFPPALPTQVSEEENMVLPTVADPIFPGQNTDEALAGLKESSVDEYVTCNTSRGVTQNTVPDSKGLMTLVITTV